MFFVNCLSIVCVSDTHQKHRQLSDRLKTTHSGDILIHAGDMTNFSRGAQPFEDFDQWLKELPFRYKLVVGGNHETITNVDLNYGIVLKNKEIIIDNCLRIYGVSWRPVGDSSWSDIPLNSHIVITHNPPFAHNDSHSDLEFKLKSRLDKVRPLLSVFGHIHADYGVYQQEAGVLLVNAASSPMSPSQPLNDPLKFKISIDENGTVILFCVTQFNACLNHSKMNPSDASSVSNDLRLPDEKYVTLSDGRQLAYTETGDTSSDKIIIFFHGLEKLYKPKKFRQNRSWSPNGPGGFPWKHPIVCAAQTKMAAAIEDVKKVPTDCALRQSIARETKPDAPYE
ncbi:unnamed protein product [Adineta ricciae]|uniref:Calcineurin-like phosphoesterase domain-containing protein n=1 Tax=Adineta ricciae TaxID=249248 RepID=A0A815HXW0_ADIRI|nr:unnamed protein product [Adineta ricciae]